MKPLIMSVLATIAAAGFIGIAGAETRGPGDAVDIPAPSATDHFASPIPSSYTFAEISDLPATAEGLLLESVIGGESLAQAVPEVSSVTWLTPASLAGRNTGGSFVSVVSNRDDAFNDPSADEMPADYPSAQTAGWNFGAVFPFPIDENPERSAWLLLLCGLAAAAFMARRKRGSFSD